MIYTYDTAARRKTAASVAMGTVTYTFDNNSMPLTKSYAGGILDGVSVARTCSNAKRASLSATRNAASIFSNQSYAYQAGTGRWDSTSQGSVLAEYGYVTIRNLMDSVTHKWKLINGLELQPEKRSSSLPARFAIFFRPQFPGH